MLLLLSLCVGSLLSNLLLQLGAISVALSFVRPLRDRTALSRFEEIKCLGALVTTLFVGHLFQIAVWGLLFRVFGQFDDFGSAFYHSTVNYTTLGYGDLVMEHPWRLAGALEASAGVMMFGVSTATLFAVMSQMLRTRYGGGRRDRHDDGCE